LFLYTLSLCSSLNVRDQISHPYKTTCKIIVLYILLAKRRVVRWKSTDVSEEHVASIFRVEEYKNILGWMRHVPPKRRLTFNGLYGVMLVSQKTELHNHSCENLKCYTCP
jgi:hypothetical protein